MLFKVLGHSNNSEGREKGLRQIISESYDSARVIGRGTVKIDPSEVRRTAEFRKARIAAKAIVMTARGSD